MKFAVGRGEKEVYAKGSRNFRIIMGNIVYIS